MSIPPYIGTFWVLEGIHPDLTMSLVAIATDRDKLIEFVGTLEGRYRQHFVAFKMQEVGGTLSYLDKLEAKPTHETPMTRN